MLRLENYVKSKKVVQKGFVMDRRRLKIGRTREEVTLLHIEQELLELNLPAIGHLARELFKIKGIEKLNHRLLAIAYVYFEKRNFNFANVVMQFDKDFENELKIIIENGNFKNIDLGTDNKEKIYKFRQDFIIYLFLIDRMKDEPPEEIEDQIQEDAIDLEEEEYTASVYEEGAVDYEFNVDDEDEYLKYQ